MQQISKQNEVKQMLFVVGLQYWPKQYKIANK
jgi:hypothetical protein